MKYLTSLLLLIAGCTALPTAILPLDAAAAVVDSSSTPLDAAAAVIDSSSTPHDKTEDRIHPLIPIPCCPRFTPPFHPTHIAAKLRCRPCMHRTHRSTTTVSKPTHTSLPWFNNFTIPVPTSSPSSKSFIIEEIFPPRKSTITTSKLPTTTATTTSTTATTTGRHIILDDIYPINSNAFDTNPPSQPFELALSPATTTTTTTTPSPSHHNHPIFCLHRPGQTTHKFCIPVEAAAARTTLESVTVTGTWVPEARGTEAAVA